MHTFPVPVRVIGADSQVEDEAPQLLNLPTDIRTFEMPRLPDVAPPGAMRTARDLLVRLHSSFERWDPRSGDEHPALDLLGTREEALTVINEVLGEGEVAIQVTGAQPWRVQESVFTGLWRLYAVDRSGALAADRLEAAALPKIVIDAARDASAPRLPPVSIPRGAMNSPALLQEIEAHLGARHGAPPHVLNLTLLPLTPEDHLVLEHALPVGPVAMISRGFGNCRITSTGARDVWRVQYFNSMNTLILNTIEIVAVPEVAMAAVEDLEDSLIRLAELIAWMSESCAEPA